MNGLNKSFAVGYLVLGLLALTSPSYGIVTRAVFSNHVINETLPVSTGTLITYDLNANANIQIDVYYLRDISDVAGPSNLVARLPQTGVTSGTNRTLYWDALWPVGGVLGRKNGLFKITLTDLADDSVFSVSDYLRITSVDIHNVSVAPSFDANQNPALPYLITYSLAKDSLVTIRVLNSGSTIVRTLASNAPQYGELVKPTNTISWNGLDDAGLPVPLGIYTITIDARDPGSADTAIQRTGSATIQSLASLDTDAKETFRNNAMVYPNPVRLGNSETTCGLPGCFQFLAVRNNASISLKIYTIAGDLVREEQFANLTTGNIQTFNWDGTNQAGKKVGRGLYFMVARETDAEGTLQTIKKFAVIP